MREKARRVCPYLVHFIDAIKKSYVALLWDGTIFFLFSSPPPFYFFWTSFVIYYHSFSLLFCHIKRDLTAVRVRLVESFVFLGGGVRLLFGQEWGTTKSKRKKKQNKTLRNTFVFNLAVKSRMFFVLFFCNLFCKSKTGWNRFAYFHSWCESICHWPSELLNRVCKQLNIFGPIISECKSKNVFNAFWKVAFIYLFGFQLSLPYLCIYVREFSEIISLSSFLRNWNQRTTHDLGLSILHMQIFSCWLRI